MGISLLIEVKQILNELKEILRNQNVKNKRFSRKKIMQRYSLI